MKEKKADDMNYAFVDKKNRKTLLKQKKKKKKNRKIAKYTKEAFYDNRKVPVRSKVSKLRSIRSENRSKDINVQRRD